MQCYDINSIVPIASEDTYFGGHLTTAHPLTRVPFSDEQLRAIGERKWEAFQRGILYGNPTDFSILARNKQLKLIVDTIATFKKFNYQWNLQVYQPIHGGEVWRRGIRIDNLELERFGLINFIDNEIEDQFITRFDIVPDYVCNIYVSTSKYQVWVDVCRFLVKKFGLFDTTIDDEVAVWSSYQRILGTPSIVLTPTVIPTPTSDYSVRSQRIQSPRSSQRSPRSQRSQITISPRSSPFSVRSVLE
jgi:hypothetical protein